MVSSVYSGFLHQKKKTDSWSFHRLDMTLAVAEALTPNKPNQTIITGLNKLYDCVLSPWRWPQMPTGRKASLNQSNKIFLTKNKFKNILWVGYTIWCDNSVHIFWLYILWVNEHFAGPGQARFSSTLQGSYSHDMMKFEGFGVFFNGKCAVFEGFS